MYFLSVLLLQSVPAQSQSKVSDLLLADEYFNQKEYQKAKLVYEKVPLTKENLAQMYENYVATLYALEQYDYLDAWLKKVIKFDPINTQYKVDQMVLYHTLKKAKEAEKAFSKILDFLKNKPEHGEYTAQYLYKKGFLKEAKAIYLRNRSLLQDEYMYSYELMLIYKQEKLTQEMCQEAVKLFMLNQQDKDYVKGLYQDVIQTDEEFETLERILLERLENNPSQAVYVDLLIWIDTQRKKFESAFIQTRAYDKLNKTMGQKTMELAKIAMENKYYGAAADMYDYVSKEFRQGPFYNTAKKMKIQCKEALVKNTYPIDLEKIRNLVQDYAQLIAEIGRNQESADALRNQAILYGFYLNKIDTAQLLLAQLIQYPWVSDELKAKSKLDLGDMLMLNGEPWEATLLYAQVEKSHKDQPLGYEAKLRNAKLSYFKGEFEFAKEHLNVLKLATHREIANDAMELSVFIQENILLDPDTNHSALHLYARAEWQLFQNQFDLALKTLDTLYGLAKGKPIMDDILFLQAKTLRRMQQYTKSIEKLDELLKYYRFDIYGDDAFFLKGRIFEEDLQDFENAKQVYNDFLKKYPASIYTEDARKRLRMLRGDKLN